MERFHRANDFPQSNSSSIENQESVQPVIAEKLMTEDDDLPSYSSLFPTPISTLPLSNSKLTDSVCGNASNASEISLPASVTKDGTNDNGIDGKYHPSLWYYESGNNPVSYIMGQKVTNPFTPPLRVLQSDGDRKKLKKVVTRNLIHIAAILI